METLLRSVRHLRVLLVEDDHAVRALIEQFLCAAGHSVLAASRTDEASATVLYDLPCVPDLAILDMILPDMTGVEYAGELRRWFPDIRLLFITGWHVDHEPLHDQAQRMAPVLYKPFDRQTLLDTVSEMLW